MKAVSILSFYKQIFGERSGMAAISTGVFGSTKNETILIVKQNKSF